MNLPEFFKLHPKAAIAFSGGTDSAYLLYQAKQYADNIMAFYVSTQFQPQFEKEDAVLFCQKYNIPLTILKYDILQSEKIACNPANRCYYCKTALFTQIKKAAECAGFHCLLDGTNASDDANDRPGMKALTELEVLSPLRLCGITKDLLREESEKLGLFTARKPAYACLATRIPSGTRITADALQLIEHIETELTKLGLSDFRARYLSDAIKLQVNEQQFPLVLKKRKEILDILNPEFENIYLDLIPR